MVDRLLEWQDWSSGLIQHHSLLYPLVQFSRKFATQFEQWEMPPCLFECDFFSLASSEILYLVNLAVDKEDNGNHAAGTKHISHFVTTFDLSQSSICYFSQITTCQVAQKRVDRKAWQEKSQNLDIGRRTWENGIVPPFTNISQIVSVSGWWGGPFGQPDRRFPALFTVLFVKLVICWDLLWRLLSCKAVFTATAKCRSVACILHGDIKSSCQSSLPQYNSLFTNFRFPMFCNRFWKPWYWQSRLRKV